MQLSHGVQNTGKFLVIGGLLVATYLLFAVTAMRVALKVREVQVPDLRNHTVAEATTMLTDDGLVLNVDQRPRLDPKISSGRIAIQEPLPGATTRRQRTIHVWLSSGARASTIPQLTGETERSAQLRLREDGLSIVALSEVRSSDYPTGTVIAQEPPAASHGTQVALLLNRGEQTNGYVMPDLIGVAGNRAVDLLRAHGFRVTVVGEIPYPGIPAGIVLRQSPTAGFRIATGEPISLEVSR
jgi:beta-lactam-binding protein with PASTA domain